MTSEQDNEVVTTGPVSHAVWISGPNGAKATFVGGALVEQNFRYRLQRIARLPRRLMLALRRD